jgi:phenylpropionate dioxygenase-like ring-hydroxylating dioxygenase large terminal subunit
MSMIDPSLIAPLPPEAYWQSEWLGREQQTVFRDNWIFAGFADSLANHNDYIALTVAGTPVVVRNMKGKLVAFRNVCSHRHSIIHPAGCGNAMFRCPYHGWTYDDAGVPIGIPDNANSFGLDKEGRRMLALDPVAVDQCGRFVFVRLTAQGPSLKEWLGPMVSKLDHISSLCTAIYAHDDHAWATNWKSGIEIALESYHSPFVHPTTFSTHIDVMESPDGEATPTIKVASSPDKSDRSTDDMDVLGHEEYGHCYSIGYGPLSFDSSYSLQATARRLKLPRSDHVRGYEHYFIYPNLQIGINSGINFSAIRYEPVTPDLTRVACWLLTGEPADAKLRDGIMWRTVTKGWDDWNQLVLAEDRRACEATQAGMRYARQRAVLGREEDRVRHFQSLISEQMIQNRKAA